ncbi:MAG TPA: hypothetical protein VJT67_15625 [Longimicrobiaceae bacterium]|nr:hypothetical protein [Longimicrobiaceae bacterium]
MSRLLTASGEPFATGESPSTAQYARPEDSLTRLFLEVEFAGVPGSAVVDTGGAYLILDPEVAGRMGINAAGMLHRERLVIRGFSCAGTVHRVPVTLPATAGESLTFEATAFVPDLGEGEVWPLPSYLGWQGCLERIRFAVDPVEAVVYFGAADF